MIHLKKITLLILALTAFISCKKHDIATDEQNTTTSKKKNIAPKGFFIEDAKIPGVSTKALSTNNTNLPNKTMINSLLWYGHKKRHHNNRKY